MKYFKITFLLTLFMSLVGTKAFAHDIEVENSDGVTIYYRWINNKTELAVSHSGSKYDTYSDEYIGNVVIPEKVTYNGTTYSVTSIDNYAFCGCRYLKSVIIGNSVTSIGHYGFNGCSNLTRLIIGNSVTDIGKLAFDGCKRLTDVTFHCKKIGSWFSGISSIKNVTIGESVTAIGDNAFSNCSNLTNITIPISVTSIGDCAFYDCSGITSITIPNSVIDIGKDAFNGTTWYHNQPNGEIYLDKWLIGYKGTMPVQANIKEGTLRIAGGVFAGCSGLTSVIIPNSVTSIGSSAFQGCSGLTSISIPNSVTSIRDYAFSGCSSLTNLTIPNSVTYIRNYTFEGCSSLMNLIIPNSVTSIGCSAFQNCTGLASVTIPNSVKNIETSAFAGCSRLTSITIPNSMIYIFPFAFSGCSSLTSITIPSSVIGIGYYAFYGCSSLTNVTIPNSVTDIGLYTFAGCSGLTSITIPNSVTSIGDYAFWSCRNLTNITIPNSVTTIGKEAFSGCSGLTSVTIPNSVTSIGGDAFNGCSSLTNVTLNCKEIGSWFSNNSSIMNITIGEEVTAIGDRAFSNCSYLKSVVIGSGVLKIGYNIYGEHTPTKVIWLTNTPPQGYRSAKGIVNHVANNSYSDLKNTIVNPFLSSLFEVDGVRYVPVSPSERTCDAIDCRYDKQFENIKIGETVSYKGIELKVQKIHKYAFYKNRFVKNMEINIIGDIEDYAFYDCSAMSAVMFGDAVIGIGNQAFVNCNLLDSVVLPNSVSTIGEFAFSGCNSISSVKMGDGIQTINAAAFQNCYALSQIQIPKSVTFIGDNVFKGCKKLHTVIIDSQGTELALGSNGTNPLFSDCPLDSVYIGRNITYSTTKEKGYSPFYRNTSLRSVEIDGKETEISDNEFYGCSNLKNVIIGNGVTTIGNWAFSGCRSLDFFSFGANVQSIGKEAFSDCIAVTKVISHAVTPPTCGSQALDDINKWNCSLSVPHGHTSDYQHADQWKDFFFINDDVFNGNYLLTYMVDGVEYKSYVVECGSSLIETPTPTKEGYTFSGWEGLPETMPSHDVTVTGRFTINKYKLTYELDGKVYKTYEVEYGSTIIPEPQPEGGYIRFEWVDVPEKMPAHDVTVTANFETGIMDVISQNDIKYIYGPNGKRVNKLQKGVNIIVMKNGTTRKVVVK